MNNPDFRLTALMALYPDEFAKLKEADIEYYREHGNCDNWERIIKELRDKIPAFTDNLRDQLIDLWEEDSMEQADRLDEEEKLANDRH